MEDDGVIAYLECLIILPANKFPVNDFRIKKAEREEHRIETDKF